MSSWSMLTALGAFHGINPGMGWLFAVALGMQERRRGAVIAALVSARPRTRAGGRPPRSLWQSSAALCSRAGMLRWAVGAGLLALRRRSD